MGDRGAAELHHALDVVRRRHEVDRHRVGLARDGERGGLAHLPDERLEVRPRERPHVEPHEDGVGELDEPDPEPVAAGLRHPLDEAGGDERPELARHRARGHARAARDLVRPERARLGEHVEDRERPLGRRDAAGRRLTGSGHAVSVASQGMVLRRDGIMSFLLDVPALRAPRRGRVQVPGRGDTAGRRRGRPCASSASTSTSATTSPGVQREWWYHRAGCGLWFVAERDTRTNEVARTESADAAPVPAARRAVGGLMRLGPQPGERIDRGPAARSSRSPASRFARLRRRHDRLGALRRRAAGSSRAASSTTGRAGSCAAPAAARTA